MKRNIIILLGNFIFALILWFLVNLNLTYNYTIVVPLNIKSAKTQGVSNEIPSTVEVVLKGRGWGILQVIVKKDISYNLDLTAYKKESRIDLSQNTNENMNLPSDVYVQSVSPSFIDVSFDNIITKMVRVKNNTSVTMKEGFTVIGSAKITPDSVKITGASSVLSKIKLIQTEYQVYKEINSNITREVKLIDTLGSQVRIEPTIVTISYNVELSAEKTYEDIPVEITGVPVDKEVLIIPPKISLTLRGGVEELSKLNLNDISVKIEFSQIEKDEQGLVEPVIELSNLFTLIKSEPQKFQYIIKKRIQEN